MKKIILSLIFVLIASMAIANVSAADADDGWVSLEDAKLKLLELRNEGYPVTWDDYQWIEHISVNGYVSELDLNYMINDITSRNSEFKNI